MPPPLRRSNLKLPANAAESRRRGCWAMNGSAMSATSPAARAAREMRD